MKWPIYQQTQNSVQTIVVTEQVQLTLSECKDKEQQIKQLQILMDYKQLLAKQNRLIHKQLSQIEPAFPRNHRRHENNHRLSEPKTRLNLIKINKNKLPLDFFKRDQTKQTSSTRLHLPQEINEPHLSYKKAESERLHYSPEKTSFFGCFEQRQTAPLKVNGAAKFYNRKFQTRDEPKRDAFSIETARKLTTAMKNGKNQFLELFPETHDEQLNQIIISSSKTRNFKLSPRKQHISKARDVQPIIDPEKHTLERGEFELNTIRVEKPENAYKINVSLSNSPLQSPLNITFYNAKSSCFPPINRHIVG